MYSEKVMDHFQNPRNVGEIENASGVGTVGNAKCGDIMRIYLDIDDNQIIRDCKFKTFGCGAAVATSSMATELVKGKSIKEAMEVTNKAVMEALDGLPPVKVHCSLLAEEAIHAALWDYAEKNHITIEGLSKPKSDIHEGEEAEEDYKLVTEINPFNEQAYLYLGQLYINQKKLTEAIGLFDEAIELNPNFAEAYKERGRAKLLNGDKDGSVEDMKKSLELNPKEEAGLNGEFKNLGPKPEALPGIF